MNGVSIERISEQQFRVDGQEYTLAEAVDLVSGAKSERAYVIQTTAGATLGSTKISSTAEYNKLIAFCKNHKYHLYVAVLHPPSESNPNGIITGPLGIVWETLAEGESDPIPDRLKPTATTTTTPRVSDKELMVREIFEELEDKPDGMLSDDIIAMSEGQIIAPYQFSLLMQNFLKKHNLPYQLRKHKKPVLRYSLTHVG